MAPSATRPRSRSTSSDQCSTSMWKAPSTSRIDDAAVGKPPLGVGETQAPVLVSASDLSDGQREAVGPAHPADVELGHRVRPARDLAEHSPERLGAAQRSHPPDPVVEPCRSRQPLLDHRGQQPVRRSGDGLVGGEQQRRRLDLPDGQPPGRAVADDRAAGLDEVHAVERFEVVGLLDQDRDLVAVPVAQPVVLERRQPADGRARARHGAHPPTSAARASVAPSWSPARPGPPAASGSALSWVRTNSLSCPSWRSCGARDQVLLALGLRRARSRACMRWRLPRCRTAAARLSTGTGSSA